MTQAPSFLKKIYAQHNYIYSWENSAVLNTIATICKKCIIRPMIEALLPPTNGEKFKTVLISKHKNGCFLRAGLYYQFS